MNTVRILIVEDHALVRRGLRALLRTQPHWRVCGEAVTGREGVRKAKQLKPDVVLMDISLPELNGLEATRQILKSVPRTEVLILSIHDSEEIMRKALTAGCRGYVLKSDTERDLVEAVNALRQHQPFFTRPVTEVMLERWSESTKRESRGGPGNSELTPRETEIVRLLTEGKLNKEVAASLGISVRTVENHRANTMRKLAVHSLGELIRYAIHNRIVDV